MASLLCPSLIITWLCCVAAIPLDQFYPFGEGVGDTATPKEDDGSSPRITLNRLFPFYEKDHFIIWVNNNGVISFDRAISQFTPDPFPFGGSTSAAEDLQLIAPYWGDVDISGVNGGTVWYRESDAHEVLNRARDDIRAAYREARDSNFSPHSVFIATWDHVGYFSQKPDKTNTFQCVLASDGFMSYVIFLYADELIQWTTGDASGGVNGLNGTQAQVGFNAGDKIHFYSHPDSQTTDIINIASKKYPEMGEVENGVLIFRIDGSVIGDCVASTNNVDLTPRIGNQLGGMPVLVHGFCVEMGDFIFSSFGSERGVCVYVDNSTALCTSPVMVAVGTLNFDMTVRRRKTGEIRFITVGEPSSSFSSVSPIRAHQVQFTIETSEKYMQLYFKPNDVIKLSWLSQEVVPNYLTNYTENIRLKIELYQIYNNRGTLSWKLVGNNPLIANTANDGSENVTIPSGLVMDDCPDQNLLCPVAFKLSVVSNTAINIVRAGQVTLPRGIGIWSGVAYFQPDSANVTDLSMLCDEWANDQASQIPTSRLNELPACPPTLTQATMDNRFRREQFDSPFTNMATGYGEGATIFYHPGTEVCYQQIALDSSEGMECCYNVNGNLVLGQPGGGSVDKVSPTIDYNMHIVDDLLPYAYCCRGGRRCEKYYENRPSAIAGAAEYKLPLPDFGDECTNVTSGSSVPPSGTEITEPQSIQCEVCMNRSSTIPSITWTLDSYLYTLEIKHSLLDVFSIKNVRQNLLLRSSLIILKFVPALDNLILSCSANGKNISTFRLGSKTDQCLVGSYLAPVSNVSKVCRLCPNNSISTSPDSELCVCIQGYYRNRLESIHAPCTRPPSACTNLTIREDRTRNNTITVRWTSPLITGRDDYFYNIYYSNPDSPGEFKQHNLNPFIKKYSLLQYSVSGLRPQTNYTIKVTVNNGVSNQDPRGEEGRKCEVSATTGDIIPQAPRSVTSFCTVIVWKAPSRAYGLITGYDVFFSNSNTQVIVRKNRDELFHTVQERELPTSGPEEEIVVQVRARVGDIIGALSPAIPLNCT